MSIKVSFISSTVTIYTFFSSQQIRIKENEPLLKKRHVSWSLPLFQDSQKPIGSSSSGFTNLCQGALTYGSLVYWNEKPPLGQGCDSLLAQCLSSVPGALGVIPSTADPGHGGTTERWRQSQTFKTVFSYIASLRQAWTLWDSLKKNKCKTKGL